jgi:hypothetical protein
MDAESLYNERPRGKPRGIKERNLQEHTQQAAGYSSSRESGVNGNPHFFYLPRLESNSASYRENGLFENKLALSPG